MAPQEFVMITKAYSDGIALEKGGPQVTKKCTSEVVLEGGRSCISGATFVSKWAAKHFVTTLIVGDEITYFERVLFGRITSAQSYSESISVFPQDKVNKYGSHLLYEPNVAIKSYVEKLELLPARKFEVTEPQAYGKGDGSDSDAVRCQEKCAMNGDIDECTFIKGESEAFPPFPGIRPDQKIPNAALTVGF